jgi:hypothetical protein
LQQDPTEFPEWVLLLPHHHHLILKLSLSLSLSLSLAPFLSLSLQPHGTVWVVSKLPSQQEGEFVFPVFFLRNKILRKPKQILAGKTNWKIQSVQKRFPTENSRKSLQGRKQKQKNKKNKKNKRNPHPPEEDNRIILKVALSFGPEFDPIIPVSSPICVCGCT